MFDYILRFIFFALFLKISYSLYKYYDSLGVVPGLKRMFQTLVIAIPIIIYLWGTYGTDWCKENGNKDVASCFSAIPISSEPPPYDLNRIDLGLSYFSTSTWIFIFMLFSLFLIELIRRFMTKKPQASTGGNASSLDTNNK